MSLFMHDFPFMKAIWIENLIFSGRQLSGQLVQIIGRILNFSRTVFNVLCIYGMDIIFGSLEGVVVNDIQSYFHQIRAFIEAIPFYGLTIILIPTYV